MKVADVMTRNVSTLTPDVSLKEAARLLLRLGVSGAPVVTADGRVLGVLSEADLIAKEQGARSEGSGVLTWLLEPGFVDERFDAVTVGDAMSAPAIVIEADRPVTEAATRMLDEAVNRLPVVDEAGMLVGLLARSDLVRAFARGDTVIAEDIEQVLRHDLWIDASRLEIAVHDGVVTLSGELDSESDCEIAQRFTRRVPGVVSVSSLIRYPVS